MSCSKLFNDRVCVTHFQAVVVWISNKLSICMSGCHKNNDSICFLHCHGLTVAASTLQKMNFISLALEVKHFLWVTSNSPSVFISSWWFGWEPRFTGFCVCASTYHKWTCDWGPLRVTFSHFVALSISIKSRVPNPREAVTDMELEPS